MAEYTVRVETIVKNYTLEDSDKDIFERVVLACPKIFSFDYPCWNEAYKATLEKKILFRYFKKEICAETVGLWKIFLYEKLNSIMPYYNQLYLSTIKEYDYTKDYSQIETVVLAKTDNIVNTGSENGSDVISSTVVDAGTSSGTTGNNGTVIDCDTPQARLNGGDYASNIQETSGSGTSGNTTNNSSNIDTTSTTAKTNTLNSAITGNQNQTKNISGNNSSISDLILKYRDTLINIDELIVKEFKDMFILAY